LQRLAERQLNGVFSYQQLYQIGYEMKLNVTNFEDFIENLNTQGFLLKKGNRTYKVRFVGLFVIVQLMCQLCVLT
jgi:DNA helicase MCM8